MAGDVQPSAESAIEANKTLNCLQRKNKQLNLKAVVDQKGNENRSGQRQPGKHGYLRQRLAQMCRGEKVCSVLTPLTERCYFFLLACVKTLANSRHEYLQAFSGAIHGKVYNIS